MEIRDIAEIIGLIIDIAGVVVITFGIIFAAVYFIFNFTLKNSLTKFRISIGKVILLGLEFLIAGDIVRTVAVDSSFTQVGVLGIVVLIRIILSAVLQMEITGRWPWQSYKSDRNSLA